MKVFDCITIGCGGYPSDSLKLADLLSFADNIRPHDGILVEDANDHRSVVYNFIKAEDLHEHHNLNLGPEDAWLLAEKNASYKRMEGESKEAWKARVSVKARCNGYILRHDKPVLANLLELDDSISGYKITGNTLKIDGDATVYTIYTFPVED